MKAIYASKLYQASNRKERINAALIAPGNLVLVQQLAEDLDDTYQTPENLGIDDKSEDAKSDDAEPDFDDFLVADEVDPKSDLVTMDDIKSPKPSSKSSPKPDTDSKPEPLEKGSEKESEKSESKSDTSELMPESPANEEKPTDASTDISSADTQIKATTESDLSLIKNTLNSRSGIDGVSRVAQKENEIWIYYNDDINLNSIMVDVIDFLMNSGYESFEFNRLARSDNAIVFEITKTTKGPLPQLKVEASTTAESR